MILPKRHFKTLSSNKMQDRSHAYENPAFCIFFCFLFFFLNETIPLYPQMLPQDRAQVTVTST